MNDIKKRYKETTNAIGVALLVWVILYTILTSFKPWVQLFIPQNSNAAYVEVILSLLNGGAYLAAFMLPAIFFGHLLKSGKKEDMRLDVKLTFDIFPVIFAGVACSFAFSYFNGIFMTFFEIPASDTVINEANVYLRDYSLVLRFITIALVPAFCEEFFFRGVILSNLMPFGKATAIIGSSVLFGLMHGNFYQFLYTTVAGIVLGTVYVLTDSIWCSTLVHLINNSISVFQTSVADRLDGYSASVILAVTDGLIFALGIASLIYLIIKHTKKTKKNNTELKGVFGVDLRANESASIGFCGGLTVYETVRIFFCPSILLFVAYSLVNAFFRLG